MKRLTILTLLMFAVLTITGAYSDTSTIHASQAKSPALDAETAVLIDQRSGKILYAKGADKQMYPASTTKILTALVAVEQGDLDEIITVGNEVLWIPWDSSKAGFDVGDQVTLRELLFGLMLPSGNDAAYTIAVHLGRRHAQDPELSIGDALEVFARMMNSRAQELGADNSNFVVPDGYHHNDHYTTALDMALIARAAMGHSIIQEVASTSRYVPETWVGPKVRPWGNTNQMVRPYEFFYEYATGLKTGYTGQAGFCMVGSGSKNDMDLIAVTMNTSKDGRWLDSTKLLEFGFANFAWQQLVEDNEIIQSVPVSGQDVKEPDWVDLSAAQGFGEVFPLEDISRIEKSVLISEEFLGKQTKSGGVEAAGGEKTVLAPLTAGQVVGELIFTLDGQELFRTNLVATVDVMAMPWWRKVLLPGLLSMGLGLSTVIAINLRLRKRRRRYIFRAGSGRIGL